MHPELNVLWRTPLKQSIQRQELQDPYKLHFSVCNSWLHLTIFPCTFIFSLLSFVSHCHQSLNWSYGPWLSDFVSVSTVTVWAIVRKLCKLIYPVSKYSIGPFAEKWLDMMWIVKIFLCKSCRSCIVHMSFI